MTIEEKLIEEFTAAIKAELGDAGKKEYTKYCVSEGDIQLIANKVKFYLDII